jgi:hypothetical protein
MPYVSKKLLRHWLDCILSKGVTDEARGIIPANAYEEICEILYRDSLPPRCKVCGLALLGYEVKTGVCVTCAIVGN